ncbi:ABC transporter substrate-binding protein [Pelistega europaea]|uniref:ABC transporter substrate-binding protein n=1 Tax=Pelistega europaea TaxID=106147 RepID=A0A7Y4P6T7_9BURK|nr:ABC transporter substrate-binding protein [Pelistega europaea]NOL50070.1 ABC transporter substrate-binding protein [Pelistega europaea]
MFILGKKLLLCALSFSASFAVHAKNTLVYCSEGSPAGFDSAQYSSGTDYDASASNLFNSLMMFPRGETKAVPGLAESYEVSPDNLTYIFHLRKNVKWHTTKYFTPSRDFNADDVVFTFDRLSNKNNFLNKVYPAEFPYFTDIGLNKTIKSVEKIDDYTVKFTLNSVDASFIQIMAMPITSIYSKEYAEKLVAQGKAEMINQQPIGTGPFIFERYQKDASIRYKANHQYWDAKDMPAVEHLIFSITKDASVRYQKLQAGECDIMSYPLPADISSMKKDKNLVVQSNPGFNIGFLAYNTEIPPFNKVEVRQALDYAINKPAIIQAVYAGQGQLAVNPMPVTQWSFNKKIKPREMDVAKAKELLAKAGYPNGFETTLWSIPVQRPYNPNGRLMAEMLQADWAKIGVKVKITTYEWGEYLKRASKGEHQIAMSGWTSNNGDPDNWLGNLFSCEAIGGSNFSRFCYAPFQKIVTEAKHTINPEKRSVLYEEAQQIFFDQAVASIIATSIVNVPMRKGVSGFKISPFGLFQFSGVSVE